MSNKPQESEFFEVISSQFSYPDDGQQNAVLNAIRSPVLFFNREGYVQYANEYAHRRFQCDNLIG